MLFVVTRRQGIQLWFAIPFTATPFVSMLLFHDNILQGIWALSLAMATMLLVFLGLALWVAHSYDLERHNLFKDVFFTVITSLYIIVEYLFICNLIYFDYL